ncbi:methyltransferase [Streptomyces violaceusniger]|uniref:O-methyltransferase family 2 n=1 Tax=Streptomyces violaceusniger (strain Tu 4113) TaxID=653045 RepID=G2PF79_STRV4|nr:methyltransferase [Streptomyces violaceusniger]AEM84222.1 O-methyltransferase family 2 [Streptomyces violaceusniger Tu 4113]
MSKVNPNVTGNHTRPSIDPVSLYRLREGIYATDLLIAAIVELDLFTWIGQTGPVRVADIEKELRLDPRALDVLITYLVALGLLERGPGETVRLTPLAAEHLVADSPWDMRAYFGSLSERPGCVEMLTALRTGKTASWSSSPDDSRNWSDRLVDPGWARRVVAAMDSRGQFLGAEFAAALDQLTGISRSLDIGGDSGVYSCALVDRRPEVRASILERSPVDQIAQELLAERGYADRVNVITGDMFNGPLPAGFDLHIYSHVLHDWSEEQVRGLLAASYAALEPGGWIVDHDAHINADKTGPLPVAEYSVMMMHGTQGKCWAVSELGTMLADSGFVDVRYKDTTSDRSVVIARKPAK